MRANIPPDGGAALGMGRTHKYLLGGIILLGTALRFYSLGVKSLWGDEINTAVLFVPMPITYITTHFHPNNHTLFSLLAHLYTIGGSNEFLLRMPAAMLGIAAIPGVYKLGQSAFTADTGLMAAFLLAISPYHLWFSQEARGYTGMVLFSVLSIYFFLQALKLGRRRHFVGFVLTTALALYTHLFSILLLGAELLILTAYLLVSALSMRHDKESSHLSWRSWAISLLGLGLLLAITNAPLWLAFLGVIDKAYGGAYLGSMSFSTDWTLDVPSVASLFRRFGGSLFGDWYSVTTLSLFCFLLGLVASLGQQRSSALVLASLLGLPFLFVAVISVLWPSFYVYYRFFLFLIPLYLIFAAYGIVSIGRFALYAVDRWLKVVSPALVPSVLLAAVLLGIPSVPVLQQVYAAERQDWRGVGDYLKENSARGDTVIQVWHLQPNSLRWYFDPSDKDIKVIVSHGLRTEPIDLSPGGASWWVFVHNGQPERLRREVEDEFKVANFAWLSILRKKDDPASSEEVLDATLKLMELQGEFSPADMPVYQTLVDDLLNRGGFDLARFYVERGNAEFSQGEWEAAALSFEKAVRSWPSWGLAHTKLGNAYLRLVRMAEAEVSYRQSIEVDPGYVGAYIRLANVLELRGEREEALGLYKMAVNVSPELAWAHAAMGGYYLGSDEPIQALPYLERAVAAEPDNVAWWMALANAYGSLGMVDKAVSTYEQVLALDPGNIMASEALENLEQ